MKNSLRLMVIVLMLAIAGVQAQARVHVVDRGETLESIAEKYGITKVAIIELNPDASQYIYVGMELTIPEATAPTFSTEGVVPTENKSEIGSGIYSSKVFSVDSCNDDSTFIAENSSDEEKYALLVSFEWGFVGNKFNWYGNSYGFTYRFADHLDAGAMLGWLSGFKHSYEYNKTYHAMSRFESEYWYLSLPVWFQYSLETNDRKLALFPLAGVNFNLGLSWKSKTEISGGGISVNEEKDYKIGGKFAVEGRIGIGIRAYGFGVVASYNIPLNTKSGAPIKDSGYLELGLSYSIGF